MECDHQFYFSRASGAVAGFTTAALRGPGWVNGMLDTLKKTSPEMCKGMPLTGRINKTEAQKVGVFGDIFSRLPSRGVNLKEAFAMMDIANPVRLRQWCSAQEEKRCRQWLQSCCFNGPKTDHRLLEATPWGWVRPRWNMMKHQQHDQTLRSYQAFRFLRAIWWNSIKLPKNLRIFFVSARFF